MKPFLIFLLPLFLLSCDFSGPKTEQKDDQHESFTARVRELTDKVQRGHGPCQEWLHSTLLTSFQETAEDSKARQSGQYYQLTATSPEQLLQQMESFPLDQLVRFHEHALYRLPLDYPTSERNLTFFLEHTRQLPECETSFQEYGFLEALAQTLKHEGPFQDQRPEITQFLMNYLKTTLAEPHLSFGNLLTNISLMRTLAEAGLFPEESSYALSSLLNQAEQYHRQSMVNLKKVGNFEGHPTPSQFRSLLVLHKDREEFTHGLAEKLRELMKLKQTEKAEVI